MNGLIAKKIGMTRMIDGEGQMIPVTLLKIENQKVTKTLSMDRDGYQAYQIGYFAKAEKRLTKPDIHRLRKANIAENFSRFKEFRGEGPELGQAVTAAALEGVSSVDVTGITKGKGFQDAITRWGAKTGRRTHGSRFHRRPGSLGQRTTPGRVFKNKHMPGHEGCRQRTVKNLNVVDIDVKNNVVALKGSIPGHRSAYVELKPSRAGK